MFGINFDLFSSESRNLCQLLNHVYANFAVNNLYRTHQLNYIVMARISNNVQFAVKTYHLKAQKLARNNVWLP